MINFDLVGSSKLQLSENLSLKYNFSLDQNYNDLNYNELETVMNFKNLNLNFNYLQEKHIGNNEYLKTGLRYNTANSKHFF